MLPNLYLAKITDNADPDKLNRVKVAKKGEDENEDNWIPFITPYGGSDTGLNFLPNVDEQVLVISLGTVEGQKAVIGSIWSNEVPPPESGENTAADFNDNGENSLKFLKSQSGSMLVLDDTEGAEKIQLISAEKKSRLELNETDELLSLNTEHDVKIGAKKKILIMADEISINSEKKMDISADIYQLSAKKGLDIESDKNIGFKSSGVSHN